MSAHAKRFLLGAAAAIALGGTAHQAPAQDESTNRVAVETAWSVFVEEDAGDVGKECWLVSSPTRTVNTRDGSVVSVRRGDILLFVTFRPEASVDGQVSFTGGYPFAEGSTVSLDIGGKQHELFTTPEHPEYAWPASDADDAEIVAAMKTGADAKLVARSSRGTQTEDTFSLMGFTAALDEAENRCS